MYNPGINNILKYLESERDRYFNAGKSGMFCDSETCIATAQCITLVIWDLEESMKRFDFETQSN